MKILVIKPSSLGDIIHSLPFLDVIHRKFPEAEIHWVIAKGFEGILEGHPMLRRLWVINKGEWKRITRLQTTISEIGMLFKNLRAEKFGYVIDLQGLFRSGFIAKATGAPVRIGFGEAREGSTIFYTHTIEGGKDIHAVERYLKIAAFLGCDVTDVRFPLESTTPLDLPIHGDYAIIVPGARKPANKWPAQRFGELASRLPIRTVVIGSRNDIEPAAEVVKVSKGNAISIAGKTDLKGLVSIIKGARIMVCSDTGPMHIAAALGIPVFALFGPADPVRTGPYGWQKNKNLRVIKTSIPCSPCFKKKCKEPLCMSGISVETVFEEIKEYL